MSILRLGLCAAMSTLLFACEKQAEQAPVKATVAEEKPAQKPNVVLFYVDDLGFGDLSSYSTTSPKTPNVDKLAAGGIRYTDAHSPAATCTPSRVAMLTGQYAFRTKAAVLPGDAPLTIDHTKETLPKLFKRAGYNTAVVGKWHLGLGDGQVNWNADVKPGPLELGFDYSFLMPATGDRVPTSYLENYRIVGLDPADPIKISYGKKLTERPIGRENPELQRQLADDQHADSIVNGISRIGYMAGGKSSEWVDEDFPDVFTQKAIDYIKRVKNGPFFLYFPFHDIHVPRLPNERFAGKSGQGPRGDAILQMDWMTGRIVDALESEGLLENTLIVFSSDNGPVLDDGYADQAVELLGDHKPAGVFSGGKYSAYEAGTRVPMITYFKGKIQPGESAALVNHTDFYASFAEMIGEPLKQGEAPDSQNILAALFDANKPARTELLEESYTLSLRQGNWKYIASFGGAAPEWLVNKDIRSGLQDGDQLFDLSVDIAEQNNLVLSNPEKAAELKKRLAEIVAQK